MHPFFIGGSVYCPYCVAFHLDTPMKGRDVWSCRRCSLRFVHLDGACPGCGFGGLRKA